MNKVVDSSGARYAVISGLRTETGHERLVIAYANEESLRDLIAARSIIALGFSSREEAVAFGTASAPTVFAYPRMPEATAGRETERDRQELNWAERRRKPGSTLRRLAQFFATPYRGLATAVIAIFFSRNTVSAVIRVALGSSI